QQVRFMDRFRTSLKNISHVQPRELFSSEQARLFSALEYDRQHYRTQNDAFYIETGHILPKEFLAESMDPHENLLPLSPELLRHAIAVIQERIQAYEHYIQHIEQAEYDMKHAVLERQMTTLSRTEIEHFQQQGERLQHELVILRRQKRMVDNALLQTATTQERAWMAAQLADVAIQELQAIGAHMNEQQRKQHLRLLKGMHATVEAIAEECVDFPLYKNSSHI
ncbi:MAG TPA: hypothetical protein VJB65_01740, partial [Patescibacteria group bacterium]|nr:hypothetical protein [Patescibacteria group bacterium]